jgi:hypothetical protein
MRVAFPLIPVLLRVAKALPDIIKQVDADVRAAKDEDSPGAAKVTGEEVATLVGHIFEKLGEAILPVVLKANGLKL